MNSPIIRKPTKQVKIGKVLVGGNAPISIQSMTNTPTSCAKDTLIQIRELFKAGAQIVRLAVLNKEDAHTLPKIIEQSPLPLVADIHFDPQLALLALDAGISGLRLNPGNIKDFSSIAQIVQKAGENSIPIRIGVNAGSLDKNLYPSPTAQAMVQSALNHIQILESLDFYNIKVSLKSSCVSTMVKAVKMFSKERDYPLHLGVTEAGTLAMSAVRSAMGIGSLLMEGLGDTIRVSVAGNPINEMEIAKEILISLGLKKGIRFIACPTCGRTTTSTEDLTLLLQKKFGHLEIPLTIAVMGCVVNGPGEAKEADIALIGGKKENLIFYQGEFKEKVSFMDTFFRLEFYIEQWIKEYKK